MPTTTIIFDAYGTLFDVDAAARQTASDPAFHDLADVWPALARDWRQKQLEYSWLRTIADRYCDFWQITQDALDWAMAAQGLTDQALRTALLQLYRQLPTYQEVPELLTALSDRALPCGILSNGSPDMLVDAVDTSGIGHRLQAVISVDQLRRYKPDPAVYALVQTHMSVPPDQVLFVSSNGWDIAGAADFGFCTVWINRRDAPIDRSYAQPHHILPDLTGILALI